MAGRRILLIEPGYKNKYPPLGLMKIAAYHGPHGKGDHVTFIKGQDPRAEASVWDRVYVTTLFSFEYRKIGETIDYALKLVGGRADRVFVGGIAASLMTERVKTEARWRGENGRAHVGTPVTNAHPVGRLRLENKHAQKI